MPHVFVIHCRNLSASGNPAGLSNTCRRADWTKHMISVSTGDIPNLSLNTLQLLSCSTIIGAESQYRLGIGAHGGCLRKMPKGSESGQIAKELTRQSHVTQKAFQIGICSFFLHSRMTILKSDPVNWLDARIDRMDCISSRFIQAHALQRHVWALLQTAPSHQILERVSMRLMSSHLDKSWILRFYPSTFFFCLFSDT